MRSRRGCMFIKSFEENTTVTERNSVSLNQVFIMQPWSLQNQFSFNLLLLFKSFCVNKSVVTPFPFSLSLPVPSLFTFLPFLKLLILNNFMT